MVIGLLAVDQPRTPHQRHRRVLQWLLLFLIVGKSAWLTRSTSVGSLVLSLETENLEFKEVGEAPYWSLFESRAVALLARLRSSGRTKVTEDTSRTGLWATVAHVREPEASNGLGTKSRRMSR